MAPLVHLRTPARETSCVRATSAMSTPRSRSASAEKTFPASWVLPGKALLGRIRSRDPHNRHRARRTSSRLNPTVVWSPRLTHVWVSASSKLPHAAQVQPARTESSELASAAA